MTTSNSKNSLFTELQSLVFDSLEKALEDVSDDDAKKLFEANDDLLENLKEPLEGIAGIFLKRVNEQATKDYGKENVYRKGFERDLEKTYRPYFIELYGLIELCSQAIDSHRDYIAEQKAFKNQKQRTQYSTVIRLHARALRLCNEIFSLMRTGYGTGALSRWRALHEVTTTMSFLVDHPDATELFLEHNKILSYEAMVDYNKYSELLQHIPYTKREIATSRQVRNNLVKKYGEKIEKPYGWLSVYSNGRLNNFRDLEKESGQEQLRPYYRYASYGIHTNAKSLFSGEDYSVLQNNSALLIGASDAGMGEVAQLVPISISYATITILMGINQNMGSVVTGDTIMLKQEQLRDAFANMRLPDMQD